MNGSIRQKASWKHVWLYGTVFWRKTTVDEKNKKQLAVAKGQIDSFQALLTDITSQVMNFKKAMT